MNAPDHLQPIATASIDMVGRLVAADPRIAELNDHAGGTIGDTCALPQLAEIARLASRLGIIVSRAIVVADGEEDLELWVRAEPGDSGVRLEVTGWRQRSPWRQVGDVASRERDHFRSDADFLWETDAALRITALASEAGARFGFDATALAGQPITRLFALAEAGDGELPLLRAVSGQGRFDDQLAEIRGTGQHVTLSASPRIDPAGRFAGLVGAATRLPAPEPAPRRSNSTAGLPDRFTERLESALRTPLDKIIANADSISAQAEGPLRQDYAEYAVDIANAGRHLLALVEDLVDLDAVERPDFRLDPEPIDLADVARRAAGLLSVRASQKGVRIDRPDFEAVLPARGDFRRALQIVVNLIGNAVRYSPQDAAVMIELAQDGDHAALTVTDEGKGIASEDHARIFDKFGRVDPSEPGGSGLGLYIARRLARAMGGDLTVASAPGQGASFTLRLPAG
ncbi:sensor histidine kinase [Sphingomonas japonica]|uniref:histidine kinase n=1 Tax=Sphingomonas japonica TaxID=511662 RepID=A0ABX0U5P8_9SPHN|nr:HAMP domain-containing sensor histidine kinase [Sphingomonas japonica]NIJ24582.1 signal transduction histidine kinase [Sphingomonas japonica]